MSIISKSKFCQHSICTQYILFRVKNQLTFCTTSCQNICSFSQKFLVLMKKGKAGCCLCYWLWNAKLFLIHVEKFSRGHNPWRFLNSLTKIITPSSDVRLYRSTSPVISLWSICMEQTAELTIWTVRPSIIEKMTSSLATPSALRTSFGIVTCPLAITFITVLYATVRGNQMQFM